MEPIFFKAENKRLLKAVSDLYHASMEPLFFKAENTLPIGCGGCFHWASMEPLFFKAENACVNSLLIRRSVWLQWSRFFSKRKMGLKRKERTMKKSLQWSRFFSKRKILKEYKVMKNQLLGFNGAAFFQSGKSDNTPGM